MHNNITYIREIRMEDAYFLKELYRQLLDANTIDESSFEIMLKKIINDPDHYIWILKENDMICATCSLIIIKNLTHQTRPFGIIENVVTNLVKRRHGYGRQLIDYVINFARMKNCHKVIVQTRRNEEFVEKFYTRCGFSKNQCKGFICDLEKE